MLGINKFVVISTINMYVQVKITLLFILASTWDPCIPKRGCLFFFLVAPHMNSVLETFFSPSHVQNSWVWLFVDL